MKRQSKTFPARRAPQSAMKKTANQPQANAYAPEVEACRADFEQLTEAFVTMVRLESERPANMLDIDGPDVNINQPHLVLAFNAHLQALLFEMDLYDERTLRKFYTEMRLWGKQLELERQQAAAKHNKRAA
jgi:hypothetical protein